MTERENWVAADLVEGVRLDYDLKAIQRWPDGHASAEFCVSGSAPDGLAGVVQG